ncbi:hypothetical protein BC829DRAFT_416129 [Chytridium lagenaria]|nr:hypothetical protein BC829DRAFT_416129 [Chytridium lagenaria]
MDVEILPIAGSDSVVTGFPGLGPVLIQGICRVTNHSSHRVIVKYISIELSGNTWGNGGSFTTDLSLIHGKRILYESTVPSSDLYLDSSGLVDNPFMFELQQDYASVLPPSLDTSNLLSLDCHTQYNLKTVLRCDLDTSNVVSSRIFRFPRYDIMDLKQVLLKHRQSNNGQSRDGQLKYSILSPKAIVPGDKFSVDLNITSQNHRVLNVSVALIESVKITGDSGVSQAEASNIVFSWESCSAGIQPMLALTKKCDLMAPEWHMGKMSSYANVPSQAGINPSSVSGGVELTHKVIFTIQLEEETLPITFQAPVTIIPVTKPMLERLLNQSESLSRSPDGSVSSFGKFLIDFKSGRLSDVPEAQLSDEEALERAIALSMEDDIAKAMMESESMFRDHMPGMSEEEALRLAIEASMGSGSSLQVFGTSGLPQPVLNNGYNRLAQRTTSIAVQRFGSLEARKAYLLQSQGRPSVSASSVTLRKAVTDFTEVNLDEVGLKVGDLVVVIKTFEDDWAEGYVVNRALSGRFPMSALGEPIEIAVSTSPRARVPWASLYDVKKVESHLDNLVSSNGIHPVDYVNQRKDALSRLVV